MSKKRGLSKHTKKRKVRVIEEKFTLQTNQEQIEVKETPKATEVKTDAELSKSISENLEQKYAERESSNKKETKILRITVVVLLTIIGILMLIVTGLSVQTTQIPTDKTTSVTIKTVVTPNISISNYSKITDVNFNEDISILGYLKSEDIQKGPQTFVTKKYIFDTNKNRIELYLKANDSNTYSKLFDDNKTYRVSGNYRYSIEGFRLFVTNIKEEKVPSGTILTTVQRNVTGTPIIKRQINITYGISKITTISSR